MAEFNKIHELEDYHKEISNERIEHISTNENEKSIKEKKVIIDIYNNKIIGRSNTN